MAKIFEALEHASRTKTGFAKSPDVILMGGAASDPSGIDLEEEVLRLYKSIDILLPDHPHRIIQFIGCRKGEGTSTIAREFARTSAMKIGKSVLLLDADRIGATHHHHFRIRYEHGWQDAVSNEQLIPTVLHQVPNLSLFIGPSSNSVSSTPTMFDSMALNNFWKNVRERFNLIIIDSPPLSESPDGLAIAPRVDGVVMVVEAEKTRTPIAKNVKERITRVGGNVLGIVLNKRRYYIPKMIYNRI